MKIIKLDSGLYEGMITAAAPPHGVIFASHLNKALKLKSKDYSK